MNEACHCLVRCQLQFKRATCLVQWRLHSNPVSVGYVLLLHTDVQTLTQPEAHCVFDFTQIIHGKAREDTFVSWLQSEPRLLLWLSTLYRLSVSEAVQHRVRCHGCKAFPITGLRWVCVCLCSGDCFIGGIHTSDTHISIS